MPGKTIRRNKSGKKNVTKKHKSRKHSSRKSMKSKSKMHKYKKLYGGANFTDIITQIEKNTIDDLNFKDKKDFLKPRDPLKDDFLEALESNTSITSLDLSNTNLDKNIVFEIISAISQNENNKIVDLNLSGLIFSPSAIMGITILLEKSKTIKKLDLSNSNMIGLCKKLGPGLVNNKSELKELNLSNCNINDDEFFFIIESPSLKNITVNLSNNNITNYGVKQISDQIVSNKIDRSIYIILINNEKINSRTKKEIIDMKVYNIIFEAPSPESPASNI